MRSSDTAALILSPYVYVWAFPCVGFIFKQYARAQGNLKVILEASSCKWGREKEEQSPGVAE